LCTGLAYSGQCANAVAGQYYSGCAAVGWTSCATTGCGGCPLGQYSLCTAGGSAATAYDKGCAECAAPAVGYYFANASSCVTQACPACPAGSYSTSACMVAPYCTQTCPAQTWTTYLAGTAAAGQDIQAQAQACKNVECGAGGYLSAGSCTACTSYATCTTASKTYPSHCNTADGTAGVCLLCYYLGSSSNVPAHAYVATNPGRSLLLCL
jgi:hypothetical protein